MYGLCVQALDLVHLARLASTHDLSSFVCNGPNYSYRNFALFIQWYMQVILILF